MTRISAVKLVQRTVAVMAVGIPLTLAAAGSAVSAPNTCRGEVVTIKGTPGPDVIRGTALLDHDRVHLAPSLSERDKGPFVRP